MQERIITAISGLLVMASVFVTSCSTPAYSSTAGIEISTPEQSVKVISLAYAYGRDNLPPPEPLIKITLKNVADEPIIELNASLLLLTVNGQFAYPFSMDISNPLTPGNSWSVTSGIFSTAGHSEDYYPLTVNGTFKSGLKFRYTQQVQISPLPSEPIT